mmetsp:Transcript_41344/g.69061  ORF Transcript_41344/g.69061 Transcript_41344/m.69061 type:complete len:308 (-) Transcript_41344:77-1000(-)
MDSNLTTVFNDLLDEEQKSKIEEQVLQKALRTTKSKKSFEDAGHTALRMEFEKRKVFCDSGIQAFENFDAILRTPQDVDTLCQDQTNNPTDMRKQHFERVTNAPMEPIVNIPTGQRCILSLERFHDLKDLPITKTTFEKNIKKVTKHVSDCTTSKLKGLCKHEMVPLKRVILLSEPSCRDQLFHRDFSSDASEHTEFNKKGSVHMLMFALTPRCIRCVDESHKMGNNDHNDEKSVQDDKNHNTIGLLQGTILAMHPLPMHAGGSNNSKNNSVCSLSHIAVKDKAEKVHEKFEVFDERLAKCIAEHGV